MPSFRLVCKLFSQVLDVPWRDFIRIASSCHTYSWFITRSPNCLGWFVFFPRSFCHTTRCDPFPLFVSTDVCIFFIYLNWYPSVLSRYGLCDETPYAPCLHPGILLFHVTPFTPRLFRLHVLHTLPNVKIGLWISSHYLIRSCCSWGCPSCEYTGCF